MEAVLNAVASAILSDYLPIESTALKIAFGTLFSQLVALAVRSDFKCACRRFAACEVRVDDAALVRAIECYAQQSVSRYVWQKSALRANLEDGCSVLFGGAQLRLRLERNETQKTEYVTIRSRSPPTDFLLHVRTLVPNVLRVDVPQKQKETEPQFQDGFFRLLVQYFVRDARLHHASLDFAQREPVFALTAQSLNSRRIVERFEGHDVEVELHVTQKEAAEQVASIEFTSLHLDVAALRRFAQFAVDAQREHERSTLGSKEIRVYVQNFDKWSPLSVTTNKRFANTVVSSAVQESFIDDLSRFLASETQYAHRAQPFKRGYCLYGPPGTFKSSLIKAAAREHGLPVFLCNIDRMTSETFHALMHEMNFITAGMPHILAFEDFDRVQLTQRYKHYNHGDDDPNMNERAKTNKERVVTMQDMLEAIDGVVEARGRITVLTGNHSKLFTNPSKSFQALLRPGRIDRMVHVDYCDKTQIARMTRMFFSEWAGEESDICDFEQLTPASWAQFLCAAKDVDQVARTLRGELPFGAQRARAAEPGNAKHARAAEPEDAKHAPEPAQKVLRRAKPSNYALRAKQRTTQRQISDMQRMLRRYSSDALAFQLDVIQFAKDHKQLLHEVPDLQPLAMDIAIENAERAEPKKRGRPRTRAAKPAKAPFVPDPEPAPVALAEVQTNLFLPAHERVMEEAD